MSLYIDHQGFSLGFPERKAGQMNYKAILGVSKFLFHLCGSQLLQIYIACIKEAEQRKFIENSENVVFLLKDGLNVFDKDSAFTKTSVCLPNLDEVM